MYVIIIKKNHYKKATHFERFDLCLLQQFYIYIQGLF